MIITRLFGQRAFSTTIRRMNMELERLLEKETVRIKNEERVREKLGKLKASGPQHLQVIADFDHTISKSKTSNGGTGMLTHDIFFSIMNEEQRKKCHDLTLDCLPKKNDSEKIRLAKAVKWWETTHDLISQLKFGKGSLDNLVEKSNIELRENSIEFFRLTDSMDIPVLVFSGGLGDVIGVILKRHLGTVPSNTRIISSFMEFDEKGFIRGFRAPLIHSYNKNVQFLRDHGYLLDQMEQRTNVLLLGDSLGDLTMDTGLSNAQVVVKIGFFNEDSDSSRLEDYLAGYDIVLLDDQTFNVPLAVLNSVVT